MKYRNATRILWAIAITAPFVPFYFLFTVNKGDQVIIQSHSSQLSGVLSFYYGGRGSSPMIILSTAERNFYFVCTRSSASFPCSDAKQANRLIHAKQGTATFSKYERATPGMGYGELSKLAVDGRTYDFQQ